jgi:hypothetical protein
MEYELKLSQQDVLTIIQALGELPMKTVLNTFGKVQMQMQQQDAANAIPIADIEKQLGAQV